MNANVPKKKGKKKLNILKVHCYRCRNKGHFARDCNAPAAKVHDSSMYISYTYVSSIVFLTETHSIWVIDSGATDHVTRDQWSFIEF